MFYFDYKHYFFILNLTPFFNYFMNRSDWITRMSFPPLPFLCPFPSHILFTTEILQIFNFVSLCMYTDTVVHRGNQFIVSTLSDWCSIHTQQLTNIPQNVFTRSIRTKCARRLSFSSQNCFQILVQLSIASLRLRFSLGHIFYEEFFFKFKGDVLNFEDKLFPLLTRSPA